MNAPTIGPLPAGQYDSVNRLPRLVIILDADALHQGMASCLSSRGFPLAWYRNPSTFVSAPQLRGAQARTPRHAAEIAAYLPRHTSLHDLPGNVHNTPLEQMRESAPQSASKNPTSHGSSCNSDLLIFCAVAGDTAIHTTLDRLLAGEQCTSSAYVDGNLLTGSVLVLTGPASEIAVTSLARRCKRAGISLVVVAAEGDLADAETGSLHLWCAAETSEAVEGAYPLLFTIASTVYIVGTNPCEACTVHIARTFVAQPDVNEKVRLSESGTRFAVAATERRILSLKHEREGIHVALESVAIRSAQACPSSYSAPLSNDHHTLIAKESSSLLIGDSDMKPCKLEERRPKFNRLDTNQIKESSYENEVKAYKDKVARLSIELRNSRSAETCHKRELACLQTLFAEERLARQLVQRNFNEIEQKACFLDFLISGEADIERCDVDTEVEQSPSRSVNARLIEIRTELQNAARRARNMLESITEVCNQRDEAIQKLRILELLQFDFETIKKKCKFEKSTASLAIKTAVSVKEEMRCHAEKAELALLETTTCTASVRRELKRVSSTLYENIITKGDMKARIARAHITGAMDYAGDDIECRARRTSYLLIEANNRDTRGTNNVGMISRELACTRVETVLANSATSAINSLKARLKVSETSNQMFENDSRRLQNVLTDTHTCYRDIMLKVDLAAQLANSKSEHWKQSGTDADAAGRIAAMEIISMATELKSLKLSREHSEHELLGERLAGAAAQASLAEIGMNTARLADEVYGFRDARIQLSAGSQGIRVLAAKQAAERLKAALVVAVGKR